MSDTATLVRSMRRAVEAGKHRSAVRLAITRGVTNPTELTDLVFNAAHPERRGRRLSTVEPGFRRLAAEWTRYRDLLVLPLLRAPTAVPRRGTTAGSGSSFVPVKVEARGGGRIRDRTELRAQDRVEVDGVGDRRVRLHRLAATALTAMIAEARRDGIPTPLLLPVSGYRSVAHQTRLWENALRKYGSREEARKWVAPPGGSAHHSGRAIDLWLGLSVSKSNIAKMHTSTVYRWLQANARRFGFYPYEREPWHWEYNP